MPRILIVEDEADIRDIVQKSLEDHGHSVTIAEDGQRALEILGIEPPRPLKRAELPDLIILDIMLPKVDGYTVSQKAATGTRTRAIPIIVLSAKGKMRDMLEPASNVATFLEKPFHLPKLLQLISSILTPG